VVFPLAILYAELRRLPLFWSDRLMADSWSHLSAEELQQRFAGGDRQAADELLRRHEAHLRSCAWKWASGNQDVADDAYGEFGRRLAQVIARGSGGTGTYCPAAPWLPWARTILKNAVIDQLRDRARSARGALSEDPPAREPVSGLAALAAAVWEVLGPLVQRGEPPPEEDSPAAAPSFGWLPPERREQAEEFARAFRECFEQLRPDEQHLLVDTALGGKRSHEHAGVAAASVRQHLKRIRVALGRCVSGKIPGVADEC
jgi:RNA polymerase sigma factor (sigma-70 family)